MAYNNSLSIDLICKEALFILQNELTKNNIVPCKVPQEKREPYSITCNISSIDLLLTLDEFSDRYIRPAMLSLSSKLALLGRIRFIDLVPVPNESSASRATDYGVSLRTTCVYRIGYDSLMLYFDTLLEYDPNFVQREIQLPPVPNREFLRMYNFLPSLQKPKPPIESDGQIHLDLTPTETEIEKTIIVTPTIDLDLDK